MTITSMNIRRYPLSRIVLIHVEVHDQYCSSLVDKVWPKERNIAVRATASRGPVIRMMTQSSCAHMSLCRLVALPERRTLQGVYRIILLPSAR